MTLESFKRGLSTALCWSDQFGTAGWNGNLDALNDGVGSFPFPGTDRVVLCFDGYEVVANGHPRLAHQTLDILAHQARNHLLDGHILLAFVQTADPRFRADDLGAQSAQWNQCEWLDESRGV